MAGLSIGMDIYVKDQFVSDDTCIGQTLNAGRPMSGATDEATIDPNVIICHAARREALLEPASHPAAIQCSHLHRSDTGLIDIVDDHAVDTLVDHLRDRAGTIGEYRGSARHCLNHDEAERLRPANGKQQCSGVPKERPLLFLADLADELDAVG